MGLNCGSVCSQLQTLFEGSVFGGLSSQSATEKQPFRGRNERSINRSPHGRDQNYPCFTLMNLTVAGRLALAFHETQMKSYSLKSQNVVQGAATVFSFLWVIC